MMLFHPARTDPTLLAGAQMKPDDEICRWCRHWERWTPETGGHMPMENASDYGWCRRYAPRAFAVDEDTDQQEKRYMAVWPVTSLADTCGEWIVK
jgi:hypothetical protein